MNSYESKNIMSLVITQWFRSSFNTHSMPADISSLLIEFSTLGKDGILTIDARKIIELKSDYEYEFEKVVIEDGTLTVNEWNPITQKGGKLLIKSWNNFVIKSGGKIDLTGKGYKGGKPQWSGESFDKPSVQLSSIDDAGGGSYGTQGINRKTLYTNNGADMDTNTYGDKQLSVLHLGSGGDSFIVYDGGNGGGALKIECARFENYGQIKVNGDQAFFAHDKCNKGGGCGSGGSIFIICDEFVMKQKISQKNYNNRYLIAISKYNNRNKPCIEARGGDFGPWSHKCAWCLIGGDGRIRIMAKQFECLENIKTKKIKITPEPYIG